MIQELKYRKSSYQHDFEDESTEQEHINNDYPNKPGGKDMAHEFKNCNCNNNLDERNTSQRFRDNDYDDYNYNDCQQRPQIVTPATEIDCIEVPKVFDQLLIRQCLEYGTSNTSTTSTGLRGSITNLGAGSSYVGFLGCRDFSLTDIEINPTPVPNEPGYKKVSISFTINFTGDFQVNDTLATPQLTTKSVDFHVTRTFNNLKLYCPDQKAKIYTVQTVNSMTETKDHSNPIIKLEFLGECLGGDFVDKQESPDDVTLTVEVTLGFHLIVKCELEVQLSVLSKGYCPPPKPYTTSTSLCEEFLRKPVPDFFPKQEGM